MTGLLRRLDGRVLPPLAAGATRLAGSRRRGRALVAAGLTVATALLLTTAWWTGRGVEAPDLPVVRVGAAPDESLSEYRHRAGLALSTLAQRAAEPAAGAVAGPAGGSGPDRATGAASETYALVTFEDYLSPPQLTPMLGGVATSAVYVRAPAGTAYRLAVHQVPRDVSTGMAALGRQLGNVEEQRQPGSLARGCRCVYAAVVRATPTVLVEIADLPQVAAVEPAVQVRRLDRAEFRPPQPKGSG